MIGLAGLFIWLKGGREGGEREKGERRDGKEEESAEKMEGKTTKTTKDGKTTTMGTRRPTTMIEERREGKEEMEEMEEVGRGEESGGHAPICGIGKWKIGEEEIECEGDGEEGKEEREKDGQWEAGEEEMKMKPEEWLRPLEYALNISLIDEAEGPPSFEMRLSIWAQMKRETSVIPLYCGASVELAPEEVKYFGVG